MIVRGKFKVPKDWPQRAREDVADLCKMGDASPDKILTVPWAANCLAVSSVYARVTRDGRDIIIEDDDEQGFPLDSVCVILQAVMRRYDIPGVAVIATSGTPESEDESPDGLITVVFPRGTASLCTTFFQDLTKPEDVSGCLAAFIAEIPFELPHIERMSADYRNKIREDQDMILLTRTDDGEICLYGNLYGQMDGQTVELSLRTNAQPEEILTEALQLASKTWPYEPSQIDDTRLRIFRDLFRAGEAQTMASMARELGYDVIVDIMDNDPKGPQC